MNTHDRAIVRDLASQVAEMGSPERMGALRQEWTRHNSLDAGRPMLLVFPEGSWSEILPASVLKCDGDQARVIEWELRHRIYAAQHFDTDNVLDAEWVVPKSIRTSGWGLEARHRDSTAARGAWAFDPVIAAPSDMAKLRFPTVEHDEAASAAALEQAQELFDGVLPVRQRGVAHISFHLMSQYTGLRGLEQVMVDMCDNPAWLHDAMAFLEEGNRALVEQYERLGLLSLNNDNTYHSSGGNGWTRDLPADGYDPRHVRPRDMWASAEAQEMAQVSPRMHAEFVLPYERRLLAPFGLTGYGCCEDLTAKMPDVLTIPRLRRVSVAPTANVRACAEQIGRSCILSWKPDPSFLVGAFDETQVRRYITEAVRDAQGCALEIILKDTHTCDDHPERFDRWARIARSVIDSSG